jgi:hypothetical protein
MNYLAIKTRLIDILNRPEDVTDDEIKYFINSAIRILEKWNIFRGAEEENTAIRLNNVSSKHWYITLPSDYKQFRNICQTLPSYNPFIVNLELNEARRLFYKSITTWTEWEAVAESDGKLLLFPPTDSTFTITGVCIGTLTNPTFTLNYDKFMTELTADGDTNYFTDHAPELIIQMATILAYMEKLNEYDTATTKFSIMLPLIQSFVASEYGDNISKEALKISDLITAIKSLNQTSTSTGA